MVEAVVYYVIMSTAKLVSWLMLSYITCFLTITISLKKLKTAIISLKKKKKQLKTIVFNTEAVQT